jgi:tRNA threonylcarbamoyladenosine biosynthesis protein TsaE
MKAVYTSTSLKQSHALSRVFVKTLKASRTHATVMGFIGELGAGKTAFTQGIARALGIKHRMLSPTFLIERKYQIRNSNFDTLYHFDWYRLHKKRELDSTTFFRILKNPKALVIVEWADQIREALPKNTLLLYFHHGKTAHIRTITFPYDPVRGRGRRHNSLRQNNL